jgi:quercetin dioxygenase-like cupin family protein
MDYSMHDHTKQIHNPRTGQRMCFVESRPELLRIESVNPPGVEREPLHIHPNQESGAEVVSGSLVFEVDGRERRLTAGESITVPAGAPHRFWNDGEADAVSNQFFEPALETAAFFETLFALAAADQLDAKGMPRPLQLALLVPEFGDEIRPVSPPWPVLRVLSTILAPLARARGYAARISAADDPGEGNPSLTPRT